MQKFMAEIQEATDKAKSSPQDKKQPVAAKEPIYKLTGGVSHSQRHRKPTKLLLV